MSKKSYVTVTDQFCGAGGSSLGAVAGGAEVKLAMNHWRLAIETHNANFPNVDHDCADMSAVDPRRYEATDILITSPECTCHSLAKGVKRPLRQLSLLENGQPDPAAERSRATMFDVCRFAERHTYRIIIVENVPDARHWVMWDAWIHAMTLLGYEHKCVYLNSMFCWPTPQSRDRMYVVFWRKGNRAPNLDFTPPAWCGRCETNVAAVQSWKNPRKQWGKYKQQYIYCCPRCAAEVTPYYYCAWNAIDWSIPAQRIGDRKKPLTEKTLARIRYGLEKFAGRGMVLGLGGPAGQRVPRDLTDPMGAQTGTRTYGVAVPPFLISSNHSDLRAISVDDPHPTQTAGWRYGVITPPAMVVMNYSPGYAREITGPLGAITTSDHHALLTMPFTLPTGYTQEESDGGARGVDEALRTQSARQEQGLCVPPFIVPLSYSHEQHPRRSFGIDSPLPAQTTCQDLGVCVPPFMVELREGMAARGIDEPLSTICTSGGHHGVLTPPPFVTSYYGTDQGHGIDEPLGTVTTKDRHGVVVPPFLVSYYGGRHATHTLDEAIPTVPTMALHYLAQPGQIPDVDDCGFRMLQPTEVQNAMAFPSTYVVKGTQREKIRQLGNAVTPPAMKFLMERCLETLG